METFSALLALCEGNPPDSPHKGQWRARTNDWVNYRDAGDLRRQRAHYDVTVMIESILTPARLVTLAFVQECGEVHCSEVAYGDFTANDFKVRAIGIK